MGMGSDVRIGPKFLFAGPGFGGSCFPKDLRAAISTGKDVGYKLDILDAVVAVNERQKKKLGEKILGHFGKDLKGKHIAVWGLAFKPGTDDIREAPALVLIDQLLSAGATVSGTDPVAMDAVRKQLGDRITYEANNYECAKGADALALVTEWREFRRPDFERLKGLLKQPVIFDGRNIWSPTEMRAAGFKYYGMGRGKQA
jgi:UDPglucose 6-dehydrogenase